MDMIFRPYYVANHEIPYNDTEADTFSDIIWYDLANTTVFIWQSFLAT
jgi:hypothetical protein